jgi:hypothetical protein
MFHAHQRLPRHARSSYSYSFVINRAARVRNDTHRLFADGLMGIGAKRLNPSYGTCLHQAKPPSFVSRDATPTEDACVIVRGGLDATGGGGGGGELDGDVSRDELVLPLPPQPVRIRIAIRLRKQRRARDVFIVLSV